MNDVGSIVEKVKTGDESALRSLYDIFSPMMKNVCAGIIRGGGQSVDDLVQDAFILAYYSIDKLKDNNKFGPWVSTITRNVSLRYLEKKQQNKSTPFSALSNRDFDTEGYTRADSPLAEKELMQLIDNLPEGYRKVFKMAVIEGYSHKEIAEKLDIEPHSSSSQLTRAKAMLRNMLNKHTLP